MLVVAVHSENAELFLMADGGVSGEAVTAGSEMRAGAAALVRLQHIVSENIGQIAVPGFFLISGYLFYRNFNFSRLFVKWKSRVSGLFIPYVIWNVLYYVLYCVLSGVPALSALSGVEGVTWSGAGLWDAILNYTYNPVFWYLFQLILLVVSAPFLYALLYQKWIGLIALGLAWLAVILHLQIGLLNADALVYYGTGAYAALHAKKWAETVLGKRGWMTGCVCIVLSVIPQMAVPFFLFPVPVVLLRLGVPVGLWLIMKEIPLPNAREWMKGTFFVYATHFLIVRTMNKVGAMLFGGNMLVAFLLYIMDIVAAFGIAWICRRVIGRFMPLLWRVISGGR